MERRPKIYILKKPFILLLIVCLFILFSLNNCEEAKKLVSNEIIIVPSLESKLLKVFSYDRENRVSIVIMGRQNTVFKNSKEIWLDELKALYISYEDSGQVYTELIADKGKVNYDSLDSEAWGNTVIIKENEMRIETEKVFWNNEKEMFFTKGEEEVVIYKLDYAKDTILKVIGINLVADKKLQIVELDSSVSISPYLEGY